MKISIIISEFRWRSTRLEGKLQDMNENKRGEISLTF